jgi:anaerobic selenocysteine-containing dehydrogenase
MTKNKNSRREFIKKSALGAAGLTIGPSLAWGADLELTFLPSPTPKAMFVCFTCAT